MSVIPSKKSNLFEPNGAGTFPRIEITQFFKCQPGAPKSAYWEVEIIESRNACATVRKFETWASLAAALSQEHGLKFKEQFPTPEEKGKVFIQSLKPKAITPK